MIDSSCRFVKKHGMEMFQKGDKDHLEAMNEIKK